MKSLVRFALCFALLFVGSMALAADPLAAVKTRADLDAAIAAAQDPAVKQALTAHAADILAAVAGRDAIAAVTAKLDEAKGSYERINRTPEVLAKALGGPSAAFDSLLGVNLASTGLSIKEKRTTDPFDQAFYENLARVPGLEKINIINTTAENDWLRPLATIKSLKELRITNQSKLDDAGLANLAPLTQLERFGYVGTKMTGEPFQNFPVWPNVKSASFRGSRMSDAGLTALVKTMPNLESLVLAHGHFSDAGVANVAQLTKLKGLEIGSKEATPECLRYLTSLPLEYLQLGDGLDASAGIAILPGFKSLKKLTLTNCKAITDDDLRKVAGMKHLEHLQLDSLGDPENRIELLREFSFLPSLLLTRRADPFNEALRAKIQAALPNTKVAFE
jgi:hypothetical protein